MGLVDLEAKAADESFRSRIVNQGGKGWRFDHLSAKWTDGRFYGKRILRLQKTQKSSPGWGHLR
jgi:hypothetical protein